MKLLEIKNKIQDLIDEEVKKNNYQKEHLNFLFTILGEVKELETLERLKDYKNGVYLKAYLYYQSIKRANYQTELLELTKLDSIDKCLEMIEKDLEASQPQETKSKGLSDQQLLALLSERIKLGKICLKKDGRYLFEVGKVKEPIPFKVFLDDGKTEPDLADEFLKKHDIKKTK